MYGTLKTLFWISILLLADRKAILNKVLWSLIKTKDLAELYAMTFLFLISNSAFQLMGFAFLSTIKA